MTELVGQLVTERTMPFSNFELDECLLDTVSEFILVATYNNYFFHIFLCLFNFVITFYHIFKNNSSII